MRKFYLLMLFLLTGIIHSTAQTPCSQSYGAAGAFSVPMTGSSNIAAVDIDVSAHTAFTLNQLEVYVTTEAFPLGFTFTANFYKGELGSLLDTRSLTVYGFPSSTTPGIWKLTLNLSSPIVLPGGTSGTKYWIGLTGTPFGSDEIGWTATSYTEGSNLPVFHSGDGGATWSSSIDGISELAEGAVKAIGTCEEVQTPDCSQGVPSNDFESGGGINSVWSRAVDLTTNPSQDFLLKQIELNLGTTTGTTISHANIYYYEDNNGVPGQLISEQTNVIPSTDNFIKNVNEYFDLRKITLDVNPILFTGKTGEEKHYWIRLNVENNQGSNVFWETTSIAALGYKMANYFNNEWSILWGEEGVYEFRGECMDNGAQPDCGTTFTDSGSTSENYSDNENETWHITPENGKVSSVEFTSFATEEGFDGLMIYDGPDITYPIISSGFTSGNSTCPNGAWTGTGAYSAAGHTFTSTHSSGILTFVFTSNDSNTESGWEADITCVEPGSAGNCLPGNLMTSFATTSSGLGAQMFNVKSLSSKDLEIRKFDIHMTAGKKTIEVYYRPGGYEGFENDPSEWTLLGSQLTIGKGQNQKTELKIGGLVIPAGETYGIYITISDYVLGQGITFPVNENDHNTYSDEKLSISPGLMRFGGYFGEVSRTDTVWEGVIYYCEGGEDQSYQQPCLNAEFGQYPTFTYEPGCYGYPEPITKTGWRGEYSKVKVTAGTQYTFSSSSSSDFITISNELGVVALASGIGNVTWTADFSGVVRFYTHTNNSCGQNNSSVITRFVQCGELYVPQAPDFDCYFGDGLASNGFEAGAPIQYQAEYVTADDFVIDSPIFKAKQIRLNIISKEPVTEGRFSFLENIFGDGGEGPGESPFLTTNFMVPTKQIEIGRVGANFEYKVYEVTFDLPEVISFEQGTYWMVPEVVGINAQWEMTSTGNTGNFINNGYPNAGMWIPVSGMNGVFFISGQCNQMGTDEVKSSDLTYYPNPVENILSLKTVKKIESVEVFGMAGQKVLVKPDLKNQQVDLSSLAPGIYIVYVQVENGKKEAFKIIKK